MLQIDVMKYGVTNFLNVLDRGIVISESARSLQWAALRQAQ